MKTFPYPTRLAVSIAVLTLLALASGFPTQVAAQEKRLTSEEVRQLQEKLESLKQMIDKRYSEMHQNAGDVFLSASQDPERAVELYFKCTKVVSFDREAREEEEFEDWKDSQRERVKDPRFLEGLQTQLRYLAITCKAAEAESIQQVFPSLLSFSEGLMRLEEMPSQVMLQDVGGSVFAQAYQLDELLKRLPAWEMVPFNIGGIYEQTVLPYLRDNEPDKLMSAWDRRIAQQTQMVDYLETFEMRGNRRDDRKRSKAEVRQMQGGRGGNVIKAHDRDDFERNTLPSLRLGRLVDMFRHVDQSQGAAGLIAFVESHLEHENVSEWLEQISAVLAAGASPDPTFVPPVTTTPAPPTTQPTASNPAAPAGKGPPPGLVPAN